jgi:hypothetical protein
MVITVFGAVRGAGGPSVDRARHGLSGRTQGHADLLVQAFAAAKLCSLDPDRHPGPIRFLCPVAHDGPGVGAMIDLPAGFTASDALARREKIAAGLDVDEFRVFLERIRGTTGSARRVSCGWQTATLTSTAPRCRRWRRQAGGTSGVRSCSGWTPGAAR